MNCHLMMVWIVLLWSLLLGKIASCRPTNKDFNIMIAGGNFFNDTSFLELSNVELVPPFWENFVCEKPMNLPNRLDGAIGGLIGEKPVICGGLKTHNDEDYGFTQTIESECYQKSNDEWNAHHNLNCPRWGASSVMVNKDAMWIFGGNTDTESPEECKDVSKTSEVYKSNNGGSFELATNLPESMVYSCAVNIDENHIFIVNGFDQNYEGFSRAYIVDVSTEPFSFQPLPHLEKVRSQAACGIISYPSTEENGNSVAIIVAGGGYGNSSKTTEIYKLSNNINYDGTWETGPVLPRGFSNGCHISSNIDDLILIGGFDEFGNVRSDMITYNRISEEFETLPAKLNTPRYACTAMRIQNSGECVKK